MSELVKMRFEDESYDVKGKVYSYWTKRSESFLDQRKKELETEKAKKWEQEITANLPAGKELNILDVGCGTGFFEVVLGRLGHRVTGIDLTDEMISNADILLDMYQMDREKVKAMAMDAEKLQFEDESFDVIITRNLTWTLPHPIDAYKEWFRVLKKGGILLNFDAEYAKGAHSLNQEENIAHREISDDMKEECHRIYHSLAISSLDRPEWDMSILAYAGFSEVSCDKDFYSRMFDVKDDFYIPDKMFMIKAVK